MGRKTPTLLLATGGALLFHLRFSLSAIFFQLSLVFCYFWHLAKSIKPLGYIIATMWPNVKVKHFKFKLTF